MVKYLLSKLFKWLNGAGFYEDLYIQALNLVPDGDHKKWLDVGCGPGYITNLATKKGYTVSGIDYSPSMIKEAKKIAKKIGSPAQFEVGSIFSLSQNTADVVSASSLLAVIDDKQNGLEKLFEAVKSGGLLLIIEPTEKLNPENARAYIRKMEGNKKRIFGLRIWANARNGKATDPKIFQTVGAKNIKFTPLLDGMVGVWILEKQ